MNENRVVPLMLRSPKFYEPAAAGCLRGQWRSNSTHSLPRTPIWPFRTAASASFAKDMIRFARSRPGSARWAGRSRRLAIVAGRRLASAFASPRRSCRNGLDAERPALYLRGNSTGDFQEVLTALLGKDAPNLSPAVSARLKDEWGDEYQRWQKRDLSARRYVLVWADGVYLQARMEPEAECMLVLIGATPEGKKELIGFQTGMRESAQSWGIARRFEGARLVDRARGRRRRWCAWFLESSRRDVSGDASPTLLAAQDVERARQVSKVRSAQCTQRPARNLASAGSSAGGDGDCGIRREIRAEIRQGRRMPDQGSRNAADIFRLSRRSLGPFTD